MDLYCVNEIHKNKPSLPDKDALLVRVLNKLTDVFSSLSIKLVITTSSHLLKLVADESYSVEMWAKWFLHAENDFKLSSTVVPKP